MTETTSQQTNTRRDLIERIISQNQGIADISILREEVLKQLPYPNETACPSPVSLQMQKRKDHLRPFLPFFQRLLDPHSASPRIRSLVCNLNVAAQLGWKAHAFRSLPSVFDQRFSDPDDLLEPIFSTIFQDREAGLLRQWMQALDAHVETSSRRVLAEM